MTRTLEAILSLYPQKCFERGFLFAQKIDTHTEKQPMDEVGEDSVALLAPIALSLIDNLLLAPLQWAWLHWQKAEHSVRHAEPLPLNTTEQKRNKRKNRGRALWYPWCNGSHFGLPPSFIHSMTGLGGNFVWTSTIHTGPIDPLVEESHSVQRNIYLFKTIILVYLTSASWDQRTPDKASDSPG